MSELEIVANLPKYFQPIIVDDLVRLGSRNDGGYVVSMSDISNTTVLISLGISFDWTCEKMFRDLNKSSKIFCYDGSVGFKYFWAKSKFKFKTFIKNISKKNFLEFKEVFLLFFQFSIFFKFNIFKNKLRFYESFVNGNFSKQFQDHFFKYHGYNPTNIDFNTIIKNNFSDKTALSIDIEGSEYKLLNELIKHQNQILFLVIEFHDVHKNLHAIEDFIDRFNLTLIHTHVNNFGKIIDELPSVIELTFSKNRKESNLRSTIPISIDSKNNEDGPNVVVNFLK